MVGSLAYIKVDGEPAWHIAKWMVGLPDGEKLFGGRQRGGAVPTVGKNNLRFTEGSRSSLKQVQLIESLFIFGWIQVSKC